MGIIRKKSTILQNNIMEELKQILVFNSTETIPSIIANK